MAEDKIKKDKNEVEFDVQLAADEPRAKADEQAGSAENVSIKAEAVEMKEQAKKTIQKIKAKASEEDPKLTPALNLRTILGGDFLTAEMVRQQIWLFVLIVFFAIAYVAFRYQCQQDMIAIDKMEQKLLDAKYKALSSSSTLTEKCRESHVLEALKNNKDSLLHIADQPPYKIYVPE